MRESAERGERDMGERGERERDRKREKEERERRRKRERVGEREGERGEIDEGERGGERETGKERRRRERRGREIHDTVVVIFFNDLATDFDTFYLLSSTCCRAVYVKSVKTYKRGELRKKTRDRKTDN